MLPSFSWAVVKPAESYFREGTYCVGKPNSSAVEKEGKGIAMPQYYSESWNRYRATLMLSKWVNAHQKMEFPRQPRLMRLQKLFKATFLNGNLHILYKVIKSQLADSRLSITASADKRIFYYFFKIYLQGVHSQKDQEGGSVDVMLQDLNCTFQPLWEQTDLPTRME